MARGRNIASSVTAAIFAFIACGHETLTPVARHQTTPAMALGIAKHVSSIGELLDAALAVAPTEPTETAPDRRRFRVIQEARFNPNATLWPLYCGIFATISI
jgi:hypothetical protein